MDRRRLIERGLLAAAALALPEAATPAPDPRLRSLARSLRGPLLLAGSAAYEAARRPYNARFDGIRPAAVAQPLDARDVQELVRWSARTGSGLAIRSGGHDYAGHSTGRGVVVDLARLSGVRLGADGRAAVGPGARLWGVYSRLAARGRALPAGSCPTVGIGGLTLGGGFGLSSRAWGLTCDAVEELEVVTADGRRLACDRRRRADLFWALRGGGTAGLGVVTRLVFRTRPATPGSWFVATWPWDELGGVLERFLAWAPHAPEALTALCRLAAGSEPPSLQVFGQYLGPEPRLLEALRGLTRDLPPARLRTGSASWLELQARWAGCLGKTPADCSRFLPVAFAAASDYVDCPLPTSAAAAIRGALEERGRASGALLLDAYGGAVNRVRPDATAFVHRRALSSLQYLAYGAGSAAWVRRFHAALRPYVSGEAYQNYADPGLAGWARAYYGANLTRLLAVKRRYDPDDLFRHGQSLPVR